LRRARGVTSQRSTKRGKVRSEVTEAPKRRAGSTFVVSEITHGSNDQRGVADSGGKKRIQNKCFKLTDQAVRLELTKDTSQILKPKSAAGGEGIGREKNKDRHRDRKARTSWESLVTSPRESKAIRGKEGEERNGR